MWGVLWAWTANAACPENPAEAVRVDAQQVLQSFDAANGDLLAAARKGLSRALPCLTEPLSPTTLGLLHRAMALVAYADRDRDGSTRAWAALQRLDASGPDPRRFGPGHGMWAVYDAAHSDPATIDLEPDPRGGWIVDGEHTDAIPTSRAFVLSARSKRGELLHTDYYFRPGDVPARQLAELDPRRKVKAGNAVLVAAGAALVGAGAGFLVSATGVEDDISNGDIPPDQVVSRRNVANRQYAAGAALTATGVVAAVVGLSIRW